MLQERSPRVPSLSPRVPSLSPQTPPVPLSPKVQAFHQHFHPQSPAPHQFYQQQSPNMIPVQSPRVHQEGPKQVLQTLLHGSPAALQSEAAQSMPILETTR